MEIGERKASCAFPHSPTQPCAIDGHRSMQITAIALLNVLGHHFLAAATSSVYTNTGWWSTGITLGLLYPSVCDHKGTDRVIVLCPFFVFTCSAKCYTNTQESRLATEDIWTLCLLFFQCMRYVQYVHSVGNLWCSTSPEWIPFCVHPTLQLAYP